MIDFLEVLKPSKFANSIRIAPVKNDNSTFFSKKIDPYCHALSKGLSDFTHNSKSLSSKKSNNLNILKTGFMLYKENARSYRENHYKKLNNTMDNPRIAQNRKKKFLSLREGKK